MRNQNLYIYLRGVSYEGAYVQHMPCQAGTHAHTKGLTPLLMQQIYVPRPPLHPPFKQKTQNYLQFREDNALGQPTLQKRLAHFQVDETRTMLARLPTRTGPGWAGWDSREDRDTGGFVLGFHPNPLSYGSQA